jgi:hypothetical protein
MSINFEVKGQLAKLLATEDLVVEHRHVETAMFNVHTRVLTLPMWKKASEEVFDMLVAHEVGHALFTPDEWDWTTPKQFVNVVEDARIEKLIKRKYAGLSKTFYRGYSELSDEDFFSLENENIDEMNLADRANLYFKIGNFTSIRIADGEERDIINMIAKAETFEDALYAAEVLYNYCKKEANIDNDFVNFGNSPNTESELGYDNNDCDDEVSNSDPNESEFDEGGVQEKTPQGQVKDEEEEPSVKTMESLEDSISELLADNDGFDETVYLELPEVNLDTIIASNNDVHKECQNLWDRYDGFSVFDWVDTEYCKFKKSAQKEVNYLVKEFECKKAADSYARATTARTGLLDCSKLHTYKYNEDLFKKVTTLSDGKNHGLIFILDWSGSMTNVMLDTIKQLFNIVWFCKKVSIPFEVYAFSNEWNALSYDENNNPVMPKPHYDKKENLLAVQDNFSLMNLLTSRVSNKVLDQQLLNIFRIAFSFKKYVEYVIPNRMSLSGTPLNESLITLHQIIPMFQKENKLQKVQCVVLTDGEASPVNRHAEAQRRYNSEETYIGTRRLHANCYIRDRKIGTTYSINEYGKCAYISFTNCLLQNLRDKFPNTNFIGIRILESRESGSFINLYSKSQVEVDNMKMVWKKERAVSLKDCGYIRYFGLSSSDLSNNTEFEVNEDATKTQIKSAFVKSLKSKKMNKKILNEFVSLIA